VPQIHYHFLTGELAAAALGDVLTQVAPAAGFDYSVQVLPIAVAAMIRPAWAARRVEIPLQTTNLMVPGWCLGDLTPLEEAAGVPVERGPKDLKELPEHFGQGPPKADYGEYDIEILAQIPDAARIPLGDLLAKGKRLDACGADVLLLGDGTMEPWAGVAEAVAALRQEGRRVAIDARDSATVEAALASGAELAMPVDSTNRRQAAEWNCPVIAVPDQPGSLVGLEETLAELAAAGVAVRIDPLLAPLGFGFAESLGRHLAVRWQWPEAEMVMRLASVTEQTEIDSASVCMLLIGFCQEMGIRTVIASQENNWARTSVRECCLARQVAHYAVKHRVLARRIEPGLLMLRDGRLHPRSAEEMAALAESLQDPSDRIFVSGGRIHAVAAGRHLEGSDA